MAARNTTNIMVIALLSVLILTLIFLLVIQNQAFEQRTEAVNKANAQLKGADDKVKAYLLDLQGLREIITGKQDAVKIEDVNDYLKKGQSFLQRVAYDDVKEAAGEQKACFQDLIRDYQVALSKLQESTTTVRAELEKANREFKQRVVTDGTAMEAKTQEVAKLTAELSKLRGEVEDLNSKIAENEAKRTQEITEKDDEITRLSFRYEREVRLLKETVAQRDETITRIQVTRVPEKDLTAASPHGEVVKVASEHTAYIGIGRNSYVRPGMTFEVYEQVGKKRSRKGLLEVNRVEEAWSQVTILKEESPLKPIVAGDKVWSPFYRPDHPPTIAFVGEKLQTPLVSKEFLTSWLAKVGVKVVDDVDINVDYVVGIEGYQDDPKYNKARLLGIMMLRESDILSYVVPK